MPHLRSSAVFSTPLHLPHPALPSADWGDSFITPTTATTARMAADGMVGQGGGWPERLLALRNRLARLVGLKTGGFTLGDGGFPILSETPDEIVAGLDDRHLDFRIVVTLVRGPSPDLRVTTLVARHGLAGRAYIALIAPFHRRILRRVMARHAA
ncbi:DUF2867 domain-containing protein [Caulobacter mirabilis]|uniref:DUF2867 domain-containing protein n=1 Tax=Caulobacter mirabilis TaxID=69666 RepID=A0A2D2B1G8_9CAUL|nr:DUF2867 domain-containing protein [Caulobacter mirabilis]ATQ44105.1 hypothetical protein CSW64_17775 [Caulobacter mirabilis]